MSEGFVSVVIPTYGRQLQVQRALRSLRHELDLIYEIIVVDDASPTALTIQVEPDLAAKLKVLRLNENRGSSGARQAGIDAARGVFVAFLDSDDAWLPGKLAAQLPLIDRGGLIAVGCGWQVVDDKTGESWCRIPIASEDPIDFASGCWFAPGSTVLVPRQVFEQIGPLDTSIRRLEDFDWFLRFALGGGSLVVADMIGAVISRTRRRNLEMVRHAASAIRAKNAMQPLSSPNVRRPLLAWLDVEMAMAHHNQGNIAAAAAFMMRSLLRMPREQVQLRNWWLVKPAMLSDAQVSELIGNDCVNGGAIFGQRGAVKIGD